MRRLANTDTGAASHFGEGRSDSERLGGVDCGQTRARRGRTCDSGHHVRLPDCPHWPVVPQGGPLIARPPCRGPSTMMAGWIHWSLIEVPLFVAVVASTHLVMSFAQTLMHYRLGHRPMGGGLFRNHINYHHAHYARGHLTTTTPEGKEGNNTPYFFIPVLLAGTAAWLVLPLTMFIPMG